MNMSPAVDDIDVSPISHETHVTLMLELENHFHLSSLGCEGFFMTLGVK